MPRCGRRCRHRSSCHRLSCLSSHDGGKKNTTWMCPINTWIWGFTTSFTGFGIRVRGRCFVKWGRLSKNHGSTYFGYKPGNNINAPVPLLLHISLQESNAAGFPLIVNQPPLMLHTNKRHYSQSHSQPDVWISKLYQLYENIRMGWCYNSHALT